MNIHMMGIDYQKAPIEVRERFSLTQSAVGHAVCTFSALPEVEGCVLLCTCNRTELWLSGNTKKTPYELFCSLVGADVDQYRNFFVERDGRDAVIHLFRLACGMKSQVFGEDQIVTQVGKALTIARENKSAGKVLEHLFRSAVTAAKRVKTSVRLTAADQSVAVQMVSFLEEKFGELKDIPCVVIGSGEMGRLAAAELQRAGGDVYMTIRQYHHGDVAVPYGVQAAVYDERYELIKTTQIVVSATASPHYTLKAAEMPDLTHSIVMCDLAVPRDIDPEIKNMDCVSLFDTDDICGRSFKTTDAYGLTLAEEILHEEMAEFCEWYGFRTLVPTVNEISDLAAEDVMSRVTGNICQLEVREEEIEQLSGRIHDAAQKSVGRMLFGLRENLEPALWESCMIALQKSVQKGVRS